MTQEHSADDYAIELDGLGKRYMVHVANNADKAKANRGGLQQALLVRRKREEFWALRDVSIKIKPGEKVAFIGGNGAGKSTLLKLLSRITAPTEGKFQIKGRLAALLEVGSGFNPELTGRENIYLNGAILGMSSAEIDERFDEIVEFSGVGEKIDTPVKRYSSGMYVRLGFSVAAHINPEILVVDEVLAVGDANFQKKCLNRMSEIGASERTVLFVSHNMASVRNLCDRGIYLRKGRVVFDGPVDEAIDQYLEAEVGQGGAEADLRSHPNRLSHIQTCFSSARILDPDTGELTSRVESGKPVAVEIDFDIDGLPVDMISINIHDSNDTRATTVSNWLSGDDDIRITDTGRVQCILPTVQLSPGMYSLKLACGQTNGYVWFENITDALSFEVIDGPAFRDGRVMSKGQGVYVQPSQWRQL
ncbi:MAG: hypothetical protein Marn2KO_36170 [Marinobacter nauticus]